MTSWMFLHLYILIRFLKGQQNRDKVPGLFFFTSLNRAQPYESVGVKPTQTGHMMIRLWSF